MGFVATGLPEGCVGDPNTGQTFLPSNQPTMESISPTPKTDIYPNAMIDSTGLGFDILVASKRTRSERVNFQTHRPLSTASSLGRFNRRPGVTTTKPGPSMLTNRTVSLITASTSVRKSTDPTPENPQGHSQSDYDSILSSFRKSPASGPTPRTPLRNLSLQHVPTPQRSKVTQLNVEGYFQDRHMIPSSPCHRLPPPPSSPLRPRHRHGPSASLNLIENAGTIVESGTKSGMARSGRVAPSKVLASESNPPSLTTAARRKASAVHFRSGCSSLREDLPRRAKRLHWRSSLTQHSSARLPLHHRPALSLDPWIDGHGGIRPSESSFFANAPQATSTPFVQERYSGLNYSCDESPLDEAEASEILGSAGHFDSTAAGPSIEDSVANRHGTLYQDSILSLVESTVDRPPIVTPYLPPELQQPRPSSCVPDYEEDEQQQINGQLKCQEPQAPAAASPKRTPSPAPCRPTDSLSDIRTTLNSPYSAPSHSNTTALDADQPKSSRIRVVYKRQLRRKGRLVALADLDPTQVWMKILDNPLQAEDESDEPDELLLVQRAS